MIDVSFACSTCICRRILTLAIESFSMRRTCKMTRSRRSRTVARVHEKPLSTFPFIFVNYNITRVSSIHYTQRAEIPYLEERAKFAWLLTIPRANSTIF